RYSGGRKVYDRSNYDQCCEVTGTISVAGKELFVDPATWVGVRDHSWGHGRTGGAPSPAIAPDASRDPRRGFTMRQWTMIRMPDRVMFWQFHEQPDGTFDPFESIVIPRDASIERWSYTPISVEKVEVDAEHRAKSIRMTMARPDGTVDRFELNAVGAPVYLQGGGYHDGFSDRLGRGVFRGEDHGEGEVWDVSDPVDVGDDAGWFRQRPDAWAEQFASCTNLDDPSDHGFGHLECVIAS
ncbi:MAG: hypothetical protein PSX37_02105, partial [bacterium]|nr:hypothetical protein [bacterium]